MRVEPRWWIVGVLWCACVVVIDSARPVASVVKVPVSWCETPVELTREPPSRQEELNCPPATLPWPPHEHMPEMEHEVSVWLMRR